VKRLLKRSRSTLKARAVQRRHLLREPHQWLKLAKKRLKVAAKKKLDEDEEEQGSGNDEEDEEGSSQAVKKKKVGAGKA